jgi:hypothetical protein
MRVLIMNASRSAVVALLPLFFFGIAACAVDPSSSSDAPSFRYVGAGSGCSNFFLYTENSGKTEALVVSGKSDSLALTTTPQTFLIQDRPGALDIHVDFFASGDNSNRYCSDVGGAQSPYAVWKAVRGEVEISVSEVNVPFNMPYRITVRLSNVEFRSPDGARSVVLPSLALENVMVGWLPG